MWTCPKCGEVHEDQFDACWKCAGVEEKVHAPPPEPAEVLQIDTLVLPMLLGLGLGAILGTAGFLVMGYHFANALLNGLFVGVAAGVLVGGIAWAVFPYRHH